MLGKMVWVCGCCQDKGTTVLRAVLKAAVDKAKGCRAPTADALSHCKCSQETAKRMKGRKEGRGKGLRGKKARLRMCRDALFAASISLSGIQEQLIQAATTSLTPANGPMRFQGRLRLEKEIPPRVCKHYPWTQFEGRKTREGPPSRLWCKKDLSHLITSNPSPYAGRGQ